MTSTQFTAGIGEGSRISSKVLKPPGGGSSDIFGLGNSHNVANKASSERISQTEESNNTHDRVFGSSNTTNVSTPAKNNVQSGIFENGNLAPPKQQKKVYVRRNPITGEEVEIVLESENDDKNVCDNKDVKEEETTSVPSKPVQTSIRVRNPPGGKSSGIF